MRRKFSLAFAASTLGACFCVTAVSSHPHVRIKYEIVLEVRAGALVAIHERWMFDQAFLQSNLDEFDKNKNGVLDPDEVEAFRTVSVATMKRFGNFTSVWQGPRLSKTGDAAFTVFNMTPPEPTVEFRTALDKPLALTKPVHVDVYDPTYYSAFALASEQAVRVDSDKGTSCAVRIEVPAAQSRQLIDYRAFVAEFGPLAARLVKPQTITLTCLPTPDTTVAVVKKKP